MALEDRRTTMSWAKRARKALQKGETTTVKPRGHSMDPLVKDGATVTLEPIDDPQTIKKGAIVLVRVKGRDYLHLVHGTRNGKQWLIGNNKGHLNGWVGAHALFGKAVEIDNG
jgi:hypothetical protein